MIESISCYGFRGFQTEQTLNLATPTARPGSGLTVLVGPNGGGKSTIVECFRKLSRPDEASFTEGKRNKAAGDRITIGLRVNASKVELRTVPAGGSETEWVTGNNVPIPRIYVLPSRRVFRPYFGRGVLNRSQYMQHLANFNFRGESIDSFSFRLFNALENYDAFTEIFSRVCGRKVDWNIDQDDNGQYYVKIIKSSTVSHNSDGLGEGILSLMFIVDALFESAPEELLVIDEPELSLHPQLQRRLLREIISLTGDRQILIATHSPEMVDIESTINGGVIARITDEPEGSKIYEIDDDSRNYLRGLDSDFFNPHSLGYNARACFFAEDNIIITEGQEDVVFLRKLVKDLDLSFDIPFWGYGAGGSGKIEKIAHILTTMGFKKLGAVYDGNKEDEAKRFRRQYPRSGCWVLPSDDIRDKADADGKIIREGIFDIQNRLKASYQGAMIDILHLIHDYVCR